jgi:hypothetical protein
VDIFLHLAQKKDTRPKSEYYPLLLSAYGQIKSLVLQAYEEESLLCTRNNIDVFENSDVWVKV